MTVRVVALPAVGGESVRHDAPTECWTPDVAAAGGWKDTETLLTCYQQPDADTLLAVMSEPKKMRDAALASG